jgi:CRISP-associated protein Cas1
MIDTIAEGPVRKEYLANELLPARMLNEFTYCPRLGYLEWVQGEWHDNTDTLDGEFVHRNVDRADKRPVPQPENEQLHTRSLRLEDAGLGLVAVVDIVELDGMVATPVDYKKSKAPDLPEGAWEPERVQLCAQGLLLRAAGFTCNEGVLWFAGSRRRVVIPFDDTLIARTKELSVEFRKVAAAGSIPPPLVDSPKCPRCSLVTICLPDETNLLQLGGPVADVDEAVAPMSRHTERDDHTRPIRLLLAPRADSRPLYVSEPGSKVGKSAERLTITLHEQKLKEVRMVDVSHVCLFGAVQISAQCMAELADRDIPICHFTGGGWFRSMTMGLSHKNVEIRIRQYAAAADPEGRGLQLAKAFVVGKIRNSRTLLRRNGGDDLGPTLQALNDSAASAERAKSISELLGIEGMAAKRYFAALPSLIKNGEDFLFEGRNRRPPTDPVNAILSFLYGMLSKELTIAVQASGLDPMLGFLHAPRYGRPSLALDLAEEFRPLLADSVMLSLVNTGEIKAEHFVRRALGVGMTTAGRNAVLSAWERRLEGDVTHPMFGYTISYRRVLMIQARLLGRHLLGEIPEYPAFRTR